MRIFRNSDLWKEVQNNYHHFFPTQEFIIGDKAYPVLTWCIPSYRNFGNLTEVNYFDNPVCVCVCVCVCIYIF